MGNNQYVAYPLIHKFFPLCHSHKQFLMLLSGINYVVGLDLSQN